LEDKTLSIFPDDGESRAEIPDNYPTVYVVRVKVNGRSMRFRPIHPGDNDRLIRLFSTFSKETIFHRFFHTVQLRRSYIRRLTNVNYFPHMALVSEELKDGMPLITGVARYNAPADGEPGVAEAATVVGDPYQGRGIGTALLNYMFFVAREQGFKKLYGLVHFDNRVVPVVVSKLQQIGINHSIVDTGTELRYEFDLSNPVEHSLYEFEE